MLKIVKGCLILVLSLSPILSLAQTDKKTAVADQFQFAFDAEGFLKSSTNLGNQDPAYIIFTIVNTALIFLGTITIVMMIVAGFMWIFAAGDEEDITEAKDLLKGSVFGLVIVLGSYGLAQFVFAAIRIATQGS